MGGLDRGEALDDGRVHRGAAAGGEIHVQRHQLVRRRQEALPRVVHRMDVMDALGVVPEQDGGEAQRVAAAHLAMVGDVRLEAERRHAARRAVRRVQPHPREELVGREVEHDEVVAHVHVLVVVDPLRPYDVAVAVEGRREIRHRA